MIDEKGLVIKTMENNREIRDRIDEDRERTFEESFAYLIRSGLIKHVRGRVFVGITGDDLQASIKNFDDTWRINIDGLMSKVMAGEVDSDGVVAIVLGRYKDYIHKKTNKKYFKFVDKN